MISPETFGRTHKRRVADVIRVALEPRGVIGFINVHESMSLLDARALICENVENAPSEFQFLLDDGAPVSARQEASQQIAHYYPCVKIRAYSAVAAPPLSPSSRASVVDSAANDDDTGSTSSYAAPSGNSTTEKITVHSSFGDEFSAWISEDYTFQQLRRDATRYWNLPPGHVALTDADGCLWPEQARILSVMSIDELHRKRVVLEHRAGGVSSTGSAGTLNGSSARIKHLARTQSASLTKATSSLSSIASFRHALLRGDSGRGSSPGRPPSQVPAAPTTVQSTMSSSNAPASPSRNAIEELWLIFTFYCIHGDSLELECIKAHQFNKLLRDARLFGGSLTPAIADIIYTSETKGKPQASGKMSYDEFLNALVKVSTAKHKSSVKQSQSVRDIDDGNDDDQLFQALVLESILPLASRWPTQTWDVQTQRLRTPEVVSLVSKFLEPLLEIFLFYARSHVVGGASTTSSSTGGSGTTGAKEFYMSYIDYQRFLNDFAFANLQVSSVDAAQVFLAACSSVPFHAVHSSHSDTTSSVGNEATTVNNSDAATAAIANVLARFDGVVTYTFPESQIGRMCMGVSAFLDALGRIGLVAFAKTKGASKIKTLSCVKAVFHHVSRGLSRTRVQEILRNHSATSIHATKFYSGTVAFNNRFLDMWRYEGSPDYLAGGNIYSLSSSGGSASSVDALGTGSADLLALGLNTGLAASSSGIGIVVGGGGALSPAASPARRLTMTSSMSDDRVISSGAGRGREALDRLVRSAFLRSACDSASATASDAVATSPSATSRAGCVRSPSASPTRLDPSKLSLSERTGEQERSYADSNTTVSSRTVTTAAAANARDGSADQTHSNDADAAVVADRVHAIDLATSTSDYTEYHNSSERADPPRPHSPVNMHTQVRPVFTSASSPSTGVMTVGLPSPGAAHVAVPLRRDDERVLFETILLKGGVFKKYGQWGNPHRRYVWCAKDFDAVYWRPLNRKHSLSKEGIAVAGVVAVLPGNSTRTRYAFMKHLSDEKSLCRCFSVVAEDRRLDLEADSESTRDLWMSAFLYLMKEHRPRLLMA